MKKFYVYVHVCPNGKRYVGCTTQTKPEYRWQEGRGYENQLFGKAVRKYGWSSITHEVFEVDSAEEMYRKEIELISFYHSNDPEYGYNCSTGGECIALGCTRSEEYRKRVSETLKKKCSDPKVRRKRSEAHKEKWTDPEFREKVVEALKERYSDPEYKKKQLEAHKGQLQPKIKISLPDGTIVEVSKQNLTRWYINKGKKFEYVS